VSFVLTDYLLALWVFVQYSTNMLKLTHTDRYYCTDRQEENEISKTASLQDDMPTTDVGDV